MRTTFSLLLALALSSCSRETPTPNVLIVVLDTFRADRWGKAANGHDLTPFLGDLTRRGVFFENAYSTSSWTSPSVASLFSSRHPSQHRVSSFDSKLRSEEHTLAEAFRNQGYETAGFTANFRLSAQLGFAQGFDHWRAYMGDLQNGKRDPKYHGEDLTRQAAQWLAERSPEDSSKPTLLYVHYLDPHNPYGLTLPSVDPSMTESLAIANRALTELRFSDLSDDQVRTLEESYDLEIAYLDEQLRALFSELETAGFLENCVVVVTSDHGEEFREHNWMLHGATLFHSAIKIPLLFLAPDCPSGRVQENVSMIDIAPTLLELAGIPPAHQFQGRSLASKIDPSRESRVSTPLPNTNHVIAELASEGRMTEHSEAVIWGNLKLVQKPSGKTVLFDIKNDPQERSSLKFEDYPEAMDMLRHLESFLAKTSSGEGEKSDAPLDPETLENLRALGYPAASE